METYEPQGKAQDWQGDSGTPGKNVQDKVADIKNTARDWGQRVARTSRDAAEAADHYVHDHPWPVIGSVAVASLLLGFLLGRTRY